MERVNISVLYHRRREAFYASLDRKITTFTAAAATAAVSSVVIDGRWSTALSVVTAILAVVQVVYSFADKARNHGQLAGDFQRLLADGILLGQYWTRENCDQLDAKTALLEAGESEVLDGVVLECQNRHSISKGEKKIKKLGFFRNAVRNWTQVDTSTAKWVNLPEYDDNADDGGQG